MKFLVLLCSALLVAGAPSHDDNNDEQHEHHFSLTEKVQRFQVKIQKTIQNTLGDVIGASELGKQKAQALQKGLEQDVEQYKADIIKESNALLQETKNRIKAFADHAGEVNVEECIALSSGLDAVAQEAIANLTACANRRLERGDGYVKALVEISDKIIYNLTSFTQEARHCAENVDDIKSATKAIFCSDAVAAKAFWVTAKGIPSATANVAKLTYLLSTLQLSFPHCNNKHGYAQFAQKCAQDLRAVQKCVEEKIAQSVYKS